MTVTYDAPPNGFRTFLILWASQAVSVFGTALTLFAVNIWLVQVVYPLPEQKSELAWSLAALGMVSGLAAIAATPIAGALVDRLDRKRIMLSMDLLNGLIMLVATYLMAIGQLTVWMALITTGLLAVTGALHGSAFDTSYAMLLTDAQLPRANGMMQTIWSLSSLLSPAIAATIIALPGLARQGILPSSIGSALAGLQNGSALAFGVDGVTFFLSAIVLLFLTIPSPRRTDLAAGTGAKKPSIWSDVRFGALFIWQRRPLLWLLLTFAMVNLCLQLGVFLPLIVKVELAADWMARSMTYETALAAMNTALAAGGLAGGFAVSLWGGAKRRRTVVLLLAMLSTGLLQILVGFSTSLYVAMALIFLWDFAAPISNAHSQAIWQSHVPRELQGRVFAIRRVFAWSLGPLGQVLAGFLAGVLEPGMGFAILGGMLALVCLLQLFNPGLMRLDDKEYMDRLGATASGA